jgi:hypothetical protein
MPSPFPGLDPYLEGSLWMSVHTQLTAEIARQLAPKLRPKYLALTTERVVLEFSEGTDATTSLYPDVAVIRTDHNSVREGSLALADPPVRLQTVVPVQVPHVSVEIRDVAERRLVAVIEVLSPTNKRSGREEYLAKRHHLLLTPTHLMEVDLLHEGQRPPMREPLPEAPYFVFLSRGDQRPFTDVWPLQLYHSLPQVPVPLLPDDPDIVLDLQAAFQNVYDSVGYDLAVDYRQQPPVRLAPEEARWTEELLVMVRQ